MSSHLSEPGALRRGVGGLCAALVLACWGLAWAVPARAADEDPRFLVAYGPKDKPVEVKGAKGELLIRPNVVQPVFLFVRCPEDAPGPVEVKVEVWAGGKSLEGAAATLTVAPDNGKPVPVTFGEPKPAPPKDKPAPATKKEEKPLEFKPLPGSGSFDFEIRLIQTKEKKTLQTLTLKHILSPSQYIQPPRSNYDATHQTLTVDLEAASSFVGPECKAELVLPPDRFYPPSKEDMVLENTLTRAGDSLQLSVAGVRPRRTGGKDIDIYVNVDNYARAFVIRQKFAGQGGEGQGDSAPAVRLIAPPLAQAGKGIPVRFEVDYGAEQGEKLTPVDEVVLQFRVFDKTRKQVLFGREKQGQFPPGPRSQQVGFALAADGKALVLKTEVKDWTIDQIDVKKLKLSGERYLQARLVKKETGAAIEWARTENQQVKLESGRTVDFRKELPKLVAFAPSTPKSGELDQEVKLRVQPVGKYPIPFHITRVWIFPGKPEKGKAPPTAEEASPPSGQEETWEREVTLPSEGKKPAEFSMVAEGNFEGGPTMTSVDTIKIALAAPKPVGPPAGTIIGKVTLAGRLPQPGETVTLFQVGPAGQKKVGTAKTDKGGLYTFKDLKPGDYKVTTFKKALPAAKGEKEVTVEAKKTATADIDLKY